MNRARIQVVERTRLARRIARRLELSIGEGRLPPGERLPSERDLSEQFGVSRPVLREALQILQEQSLVTTRPGRGTFVRDLSGELGRATPADWLRLNHPRVREFYEARLLIEPECAARAAARRTESQLVGLKQIVHSSERVVAEGRAIVFTGLDIDFHTCIAEMSGSRLLEQMLATIIHPETDLRRVLHLVPGHLAVAQGRHARIVRAIEEHDPNQAHRAMSDALKGSLDDIDRLITGQRRG